MEEEANQIVNAVFALTSPSHAVVTLMVTSRLLQGKRKLDGLSFSVFGLVVVI